MQKELKQCVRKLAIINSTASFDIFPYHAYHVKVFVPFLLILPYMDKDFIGSTTTSIGYDEALTETNAMFLVTVLIYQI